MIKITDKSFRYTTSFNTDLKKKFRQVLQRQRQLAAEKQVAAEKSKTSGAAVIVPMVSPRSVAKL